MQWTTAAAMRWPPALILGAAIACGGAGSAGTSAGAVHAVMVLSASRALPGDVITADGTASAGPSLLTYEFQWGDGTSSTGSAAVATHVYETVGSFTVTMTVESDATTATASAPIGIWSNSAPVMQLSWTSGVMPGDPVVVDASGSTAANGIASFTFLADGAAPVVQSSPVATFTFDRAGLFNVLVTVTDRGGGTTVRSVGVVVGLAFTRKTQVPSESALRFRTGEHLARDQAGTLYAVWFDGGGLAFSRSFDGGKTFEPQTTIVDAGGPFQVDAVGSALAVDDGGGVHIAWAWNEGDFAYVHSSDGGASFSPVVLFDSVPGLVSYSPAIAMGAAGRVTVAWVQSAPGPAAPASSPIATSSDRGDTYSVVGALPAPDFANCGTSIAYDGAVMVAAWHGFLVDPITARAMPIIQVATSGDDGLSFAPATTLDSDPNTSCPSVIAEHGHIAVSWVAGSIAQTRRFIVAVSGDHGATFGQPLIASSPFASATCGHVTFDEMGNLYVAYLQAGSAGGHQVRASSDGGRNFGPALDPTVIPPEGTCAEIHASAPGMLDLIWSEARRDGTNLFDVFYGSAKVYLP